jgi:ribonuclease HI
MQDQVVSCAGSNYTRRVKQVTIHSDGACEGNPGPGGWAAILQYGKHQREISGHILATTNNRMEIQAALEGLRALKEPCEVQFYTDSEYLRNAMTLWVRAWKANGWRKKPKGQRMVKNADLWQELDALAATHAVTWHWVRGHSGHPLNERCDVLAVKAIAELRTRHKPEEFAQALAAFTVELANKSRVSGIAVPLRAPVEMPLV